MNNKQALEYFKNLSKENIDITTTKINKCNDFSSTDANFILKYASKNSTVLDLASGTGITVNKYFDKVKKVIAVEKFNNFSKFIKKAPNIEIYNEDIFEFKPQEKFDIITMFGIMHYLNKKEAKQLYDKYKNYLNKGGKLLIKQQFAIQEDVIVAGYSEELKQNYYSEYRTITHEKNILKELGYKIIEVIDIYPKKSNRWNNTHFWALVVEN